MPDPGASSPRQPSAPVAASVSTAGAQRQRGVPADLLAVRQGVSHAAWLVGIALAARWGSRLSACRLSAAPEHREPSVLALLQRSDERERTRDSSPGQVDAHVFARIAQNGGVDDARWLSCGGQLADTLHRLGAWHDLAIVDRDSLNGDDPFEHFGQALLGSRMPCLLLPEDSDSSGTFARVAIGWNGSIEATRAIHAALPFLHAAGHVVLIDGTVTAIDDEAEESMPAFDPTTYLAGHGIALERRLLRTQPSQAGEALLDAAMRERADLLVMGGYSHSPVRERVLGGATRHILAHATLPVFVRH